MTEGSRRRSIRLMESPKLNKLSRGPPTNVDNGGNSNATTEETPKISLTRNVSWGNGLGQSKKLKTSDKNEQKLNGSVVKPTGNNVRESSDDDEFVTPTEIFSHNNNKSNKKTSETKRKLKIIGGPGIRVIYVSASGEYLGDENDMSRINLDEMEIIADPEANNGVDEAVRNNTASLGNATEVETDKNAEVVEDMIITEDARDIEKNHEKKARNYDNYIQKKFSPAIMRDVIVNLSDEQAAWARRTGFGGLLDFRMECYVHRTGYSLVESFRGNDCSLHLRAGKILIDDNAVHATLGLPKGVEKVELRKSKKAYGIWGEQFPGKKTCQITPNMVKDKLINSQEADENFKLNFLVMMYNFFIEGLQNRYLMRDIVRFSGDLDNCGKYNWCALLREKLIKTHAFWAEDKTRNFTGALPLLIYLYVSRIRNSGTTSVPLQYPAYKGWSDMLLRERQKYDISNDCFGVGELLSSGDVHSAAKGGLNSSRNKLRRSNIRRNNKGTIQNEVVKTKKVDSAPKDAPETGIMEYRDEIVQDSEGGSLMEEDNIEALISEVCNKTKDYVNHDGAGERNFQEDNATNVECENEIGRRDMQTNGEDIIVQPPLTGESTNDKLLTMTEYLEKHFAIVGAEAAGNKSSGKENLEDESTEYTRETHVPEVGTQARIGEEIERHFEEETCVERFVESMNELDSVFKKCVTECVSTFALFPNNERLAKLRDDYPMFFKLFAEDSPMTKSLCSRLGKNKKVIGSDEEDGRYIPSYSLGLSQMSPTKGHKDIERGDGVADKTGAVISKLQLRRTGVEQVEKNVSERPRRGLVPAQACRSPFVSRIVDIGEHRITADERNLWDWLMQNKRNKKDILFQWQDCMCTKAHLQSLSENKMVETTLIDTWSYVLNENEILRNVHSPLRLFFTTEATYGPLKIPSTDLRRYSSFDDHLELTLKLVHKIHQKTYDIPDFDLFIFPIYEATHHYLIVYNLKKPSWEILDNRVFEGNFEESYGDIPDKLHDCFCKFLAVYNLPKIKEIQKLEPVVVPAMWQTRYNSSDCGIFVMRHMETYMGNPHLWKTGLRTEGDNQRTLLNKLRMIYCHRILTWSGNQKRKIAEDGIAEIAQRRK